MNKKIWYIFLIIVISFSVFSGCKNNNTAQQTNQNTENELKYFDENIIKVGEKYIKDNEESIYNFFDNKTEKLVKGEKGYYYFKIYENFDELKEKGFETLEFENNGFIGTLEFSEANRIANTDKFFAEYKTEEFKTK